MKKILFISLFALGLPVMAQQKLSLKECLQMGLENNLQLKSSFVAGQKGQYSISENRAKLLPQINMVAGFNDNFTPPVSVTDARSYGKLYNVTNTLQYNASAGLQLQMPLYSQMVNTAIEISKTASAMNRLSHEKLREDIIMQIAKVYYLAQNTREQLGIVNENIRRFEELKGIAQAFYDNQMALEVDLKRINVRLESIRVQAANAEAMLKEQYNMLKYMMDYPADQDIEVEEKSVEELDEAALSGLDTNLYELQLMQKKVTLADQQTKLAKEGYLPTVALTGSLMYSAFSEKFSNWFHNTEANHWYGSNGLGISVRVPIFDGFEKRSKIRKAKLDAEVSRIEYENALKGMQTQYINAVKDQANNERNYQRQKETYQLAESVYDVTYDRYKEGIASMIELLTDQMSMSDAQNGYLTAHFNYQLSNLTLLKLTGKLHTLAD